MQIDEIDILTEQTKQIYDAVNKAIFGNIINAIILVSVLWSAIDHKILLIWLVAVISISVIRAITAYRFKHVDLKSKDEIYTWHQRFVYGSVITSIIWGSSSIWLFPVDDLARQVFLAFVIGGMATAAVAGLSYIKSAINLYLFITLLPLLLRFFYSGTELSVPMGIMTTLFLVVLFQAAKETHIKYKQNICMHIDNVQQQQSLSESEHRYQTLLDTATDAFFLHDLEGKFVDVNKEACRSLGYSRDELLNMIVSDIECNIKEEDIENIWAEIKENQNIRLNGIHRRKNGTTFPVEVSLGAISMGDDTYLSVLARDVTERNRIDEMKNEFVSTVSHELRTPLTSIRGSLGLLMGGAAGDIPQTAKDMLTVACNNSDRLLLLINDILDMQKLDSGDFQMVFEEFELLPVLEQAVRDNESYAEKFGISLTLKPFQNNLKINGDKNRIMQVLANLISNAAKFSYKDNVVSISVEQPVEDTVKVLVTNFGEVIPEEFHPKIFGKFSQSDSSDTREKGGTGLGLNISKAIIEKHDGTIGFTSDKIKGTTFYFELPLVSNNN